MAQIILYRKADVRVPRMGKRQIATALAAINKTARVKRDPLVEFILGGGWNKLPVTPQHVIDSPHKRRAEGHGWVVPDSCHGRGGVATFSQNESQRIWVPKNIGPVLPCDEDQRDAILHAMAFVFDEDAS